MKAQAHESSTQEQLAMFLKMMLGDGYCIIRWSGERKRKPGNKSDLGKAKVALMRRILKSEPCSVIRLSQLLKANRRAVSNALKAVGAVPAGKVFSPSGKRTCTTWYLP